MSFASHSPTVFLDAIAYELGELQDIERIKDLAEDPGLLEVFRIRGLGTFAESDVGARELARRVAERSLSACGVPREDFDVVLYATDLLPTEALFSTTELNGLLNDLGLPNAYPLGVSLGACANFAPAIQIAASLVQTGGARNVLLVIVEKLQEPHSRLMDLGMSVLSDAAVACVVRGGSGAYEVLRVGRASTPAVQSLSLESDSRAFFAATATGVKRAVDDALGPFGMSRGDVARVLSNNYVSHIQKAFVQNAGFVATQCYFENVARFAHAFSADTLINLKDSEDERPLRAGERALLLGTAPTSWAAVLLEAKGP